MKKPTKRIRDFKLNKKFNKIKKNSNKNQQINNYDLLFYFVHYNSFYLQKNNLFDSIFNYEK